MSLRNLLILISPGKYLKPGAYHGMVQAADLSSCESVLVNAGHTTIGQAAIALALQIGSTVFTTVAESDHKDFLIKRFPQYSPNVCEVLGSNKWTSAAPSYTVPPHIFRITGMFMFLKNITVFGIALDNLFNASLAWKKELHSEIQKAINSGVVQPLERKVFTKQQALSALRNLSNRNYTGKVVLTLEKGKKSILNTVKETPKFLFDPKNSHLIIGTKLEDCLDLAEWLVSQEANKITIASKSPEMSALSKRRLFLLRHYHHAHILQLTTNKISTLPGASSLIRNASNLGPLTTIFAIALNDATSLHNLDVASRSLDSLSHFVSLMDKSGEDVSKERFKAGLPILDVQWTDSQKSVNIGPILKVMDRLLSSRSPPFVYISLSHKHNKNFKEVSSYDETIHFLPSSLDALEGVGKDFLSKAKSPLVVTPSLSPGIGLVPEVPPIFIVPGIQDQIEKHMRSIQPVGPYNIVGVLWGGILSLELARVLKSQDQKTKIFLLDGAPETSQSLVRQLGTGDELQCNLITKLLDIESNKSQPISWEDTDWDLADILALEYSDE
uniref:Enoyl reductase (ER) domain-containing protein n=1 Tax=Timema tahoe TaxID=61484 RepID=A0A7R9IFD0_9NEOP|nr:unnamed protein product [Timema tahoe]